MNPAVIECVPAATRRIYAAGRRAVAWEGILERLASSKTSDIARLVQIKAAEARGGLREAIWQSYNQVRVYGEDAAQRVYDLGEIHCSSAATLTGLVVDHLEKQSHSFFPMEND